MGHVASMLGGTTERDIALPPACLGGAGPCPAPAAYWAAWADALPVLATRNLALAEWTVRALTSERAPACLRAAGGRGDPHTSLAPDVMQIALRRRLKAPAAAGAGHLW